MSSIDEIRGLRIKKLELFKKKGLNPYPAESKRELTLGEAIENFENLEKDAVSKWIAGRIMSIRGQGAIGFITFLLIPISIVRGADRFKIVQAELMIKIVQMIDGVFDQVFIM